MDVLSLLEELDQMIEQSSSMPFSKKILIEKERAETIVKDIKNKLPDELKQAKWVKEERQRILSDAQKEANEIIKEAENKVISMIDEHEITKQAYEQRAEIIESAEAYKKDLMDTAENYKKDLISATRAHADGILEDLEKLLKQELDTVKSNRKELK